MEFTRRRLLSGVAATVSAGMFAGCIGDGSTGGSDSSGAAAQASFFVFGEISARVAGDTAEAGLLVPTGQHGHGWSPSPSVREDIRDADLFVHGMTGFQPWVDDIRSDLDDLHERIDDTVAGASKDVLLVAGHDAMQYFGDRYGVRVEALTNVSPDDRPTTRDIETAQEIIDEHDLEYVCADPLESQTAPNQLVEETDATEVLELTAMPGLEAEWDEEDWGYIDVMENVNLPTLERALDA